MLQFGTEWSMPDTAPPLAGEAVLEVVSPDGARRFVRVTQTPFMIGRGAETGNHLQLSDRRISRNCAAVVIEANRFYVEDRGQRRGLFVNGERVDSRELQDGDAITFGLDDSYEIIFRSSKGTEADLLPQLLTRMEHITSSEPTGGGLVKLKRLLEATSLLHSQLPLEVVLGHMLDHAISVTDADRGLLLETDSGGTLKVKLARRSGGLRLPPESLTPSQTAIQLALKQQSPVITEDLAQADVDLQAAQSIVAQRLRAVVVIPLFAMSRANTQESMVNIKRGDFLGILYLDSRRPAAFSTTPGSSNASANASASSRRSTSHATFSRPFSRAISANTRISRLRDSIFLVCQWEGITSTSFRLAMDALRFSSRTSRARDSAPRFSPPCCRARSRE
jgi:sigma-B regulation protein RsbU (phosphoserine phosphatase)